MRHGVAGQVFVVRAFNSSGRVSGDAANITCTISIDGGSPVALSDTNPTEDGSTGQYTFTLTAAETVANKQIVFNPVSSTSGVEVMGAAGNVITPVILLQTNQQPRAATLTTYEPEQFQYLRPNGVDSYLRTDGTSLIYQPAA